MNALCNFEHESRGKKIKEKVKKFLIKSSPLKLSGLYGKENPLLHGENYLPLRNKSSHLKTLALQGKCWIVSLKIKELVKKKYFVIHVLSS